MCSIYLKYRGTPDENQQCEISAPREKGKDQIRPSGAGCWQACSVCVLSPLLPVPLISQAALKDKKKVGNHTPTDGSLVSYSLFRWKQLRFISFFFFFFYSYIMVNFQLLIYFEEVLCGKCLLITNLGLTGNFLFCIHIPVFEIFSPNFVSLFNDRTI